MKCVRLDFKIQNWVCESCAASDSRKKWQRRWEKDEMEALHGPNNHMYPYLEGDSHAQLVSPYLEPLKKISTWYPYFFLWKPLARTPCPIIFFSITTALSQRSSKTTLFSKTSDSQWMCSTSSVSTAKRIDSAGRTAIHLNIQSCWVRMGRHGISILPLLNRPMHGSEDIRPSAGRWPPIAITFS